MKIYDLVIIGAGPAGMTAAIYGVRANLKVLLLDKLAPGGQVINTNDIENWPGFASINGADLSMQMFEHCMALGVEFDYKTVAKIDVDGDIKKIHTEEDEETISTKSIIVSSGSKPRRLNLPGEEEFAGTSISWCAICDGAKYRDKDVVIIGGGNSAVDEGTYLAGITKSLTIITDFDLTADPVSCDFLRSRPNVTVHPYKSIIEFVAKEDGTMLGVKFADKETGENEQIAECDGVFEYIGLIPTTKFVEDLGIINQMGYLEVDEKMRTSIPGIYGAGDSNSKFLRQITTAVSDGAIAALEAAEYIKGLSRKE